MASRNYEHPAVPEPKVVVIRKSNQGFGFTVRHFIKYPPEGTIQTTPPMETVFIKEVHPNGPAYFAGLQQGDRLLKVNNMSIAGVPYSTIVYMIKQTPNVLTLHVVPKECDVLQLYFEDLAHNPESNRIKPFADVPQNIRLGPNHNQPVHNLYSPIQNLHSNFLGAMKFPADEPMASYNNSYLLSPNQPLLLNRLKKSIMQKEEFLRLPPSFQTTTTVGTRPSVSSTRANDVFSQACDIEIKSTSTLRQSESKQPETNATLPTGIGTASFKRETSAIVHNNNNQIPPPYEPPPSNFKSSISFSLNSPQPQLPTKDNAAINQRPQILSPVPLQGSKSNEYVNQFLRHTNDDNSLKGRYSCDRIKDNSNINNEILEKRHSDDFNVVSQLTKKFESGAPLSPETQMFYKSELSRFNKFPNPIVNIRKKEIELKTRLENESIIQNSRNDLKVLETPNNFKDIEIKCNFDDVNLSKCDQFEASTAPTIVVRRQKPTDIDDKKIPRRISYLRATGNDKEYHSDIPSCPEATVSEEEVIDKDDSIRKSNTVPMIDKTKSITLESEMNIKTSGSADKISHCRSWHACKVHLVDNILKAYTKHDANVVEIDVRDFNVSEDDLNKRKCVFKLTPKSAKTHFDKHSSPIEIHFETKNTNDFRKWLRTLQEMSFHGISHDIPHSKSGSQLAEPQQVSAITSVQTTLYEENAHTYETEGSVSTENGINHTVTVKTRKTSTSSSSHQHKEFSEKEMGSPKSRTWKHLFRKIQGNNDAHSSYSPPPPVGSIGVPLKLCPMSKDNEYVPYLVDLCTKIVESKGLTVKGIYRIPGNKAAISELRDQVNKKDFDFENSIHDPKWEDVNVVSSLLKLFIRSLPDALLPSSFYNNFIEADKKTGEKRCKELLALLQSLPKVSYETLKHIIRHIHRVSQHCEVNLMEPKNLAIIFGPSIIRTPDETLEIAVKDMKYQCRIVELFITQYEYFFESGALPELAETPTAQTAAVTQQEQTNLLLGNVSKIEQKIHDKESISSRFIPHLRRRGNKKSGTNSDTHSGESISSFEAKPTAEDKPKDGCEFRHRDDQDSLDGGSTEQTEDDELNASQNSDTGSMSLTTVTDVLETKLRDIRKTPDSPEQKENISKSTLSSYRRNQTKPLTLGENIPYADESPERNYAFDGTGRTPVRAQYTKSPLSNYNYDTKTTSSRTSSSYTHDLHSDDSEVSTTSDPKDTLVISPLILERLKKRRDYRLFRSASFNCRNYSSRAAQSQQSTLTKDEKTDMNITKKRQIQNKQNRSIKRRHTLGSPNDYFTTITRRTNNDNMIEVGIRIKNVKKRS